MQLDSPLSSADLIDWNVGYRYVVIKRPTWQKTTMNLQMRNGAIRMIFTETPDPLL